ncbi:Crp/Fnr family transcriptional regulator [Caldimonas sp. KR1-144]|uniref:Crp/Fnr family transcriptional regulator n=1 Tax=Caldimonas sp. KR1-144 TaxID=3400911 RepID=UPI003BFACF19
MPLQAAVQPAPRVLVHHLADQRPAPSASASHHTIPRVDGLGLIERHVEVQRRMLRAGEAVYKAGDRFTHLHIVHSGCFKVVNVSPDGREKVVAVRFKGDWLGFDGIADGRHDCDAIAMDTGAVLTLRYDALVDAARAEPALMMALHAAMSREIARDRTSMMSLCTLPSDARVAEFLRDWAQSLAERGLRTDQITLRMTRAEIGNFLGMTLESVSRALSRLAREQVIRFAEKARRELQIPDIGALERFIERCCAPARATLQ